MNGYQVTDELWARVEPLIPKHVNKHPRGGGRKRADDRKVFDAILFVARTGCQWKALDATGICSGSTAHLRFQEWTKAGLFQQLWKIGLIEYDNKKEIVWKWQAMDEAMTKAPLGGEKIGNNPTDRGKTGTKRSLLIDGKGIPLGIEVSGANRHDSRLVEATLRSVPIKRPKVQPYHRQHLCLDVGYVGDEVAAIAHGFHYTLHVRPRGEETKALREQVGFRARRWVVERTHRWLNRFRRILVRWEKCCENYLAMLHWSFALITFGKLFTCF